MMRKCANKLIKDNRGATLALALLFFIVCAAVGSVVLAAGTAASGRLSTLKDSDLRYYSVTSAAELLKDQVEDVTVTIVLEKETSTKTAYSVDSAGVLQQNGQGSTTTYTGYSISGEPKPESDAISTQKISAVFVAALEKVFSLDSSPDGAEAVWNQTFLNGTASGTVSQLELNLNSAPLSLNAKAVQAGFNMKSNGDVVLIINNKVVDGDKDTNQYILNLNAPVVVDIDESTQFNTSTETTDDGGYTVVDTETTTRTITFTWKDASVDKPITVTEG